MLIQWQFSDNSMAAQWWLNDSWVQLRCTGVPGWPFVPPTVVGPKHSYGRYHLQFIIELWFIVNYDFEQFIIELVRRALGACATSGC